VILTPVRRSARKSKPWSIEDSSSVSEQLAGYVCCLCVCVCVCAWLTSSSLGMYVRTHAFTYAFSYTCVCHTHARTHTHTHTGAATHTSPTRTFCTQQKISKTTMTMKRVRKPARPHQCLPTPCRLMHLRSEQVCKDYLSKEDTCTCVSLSYLDYGMISEPCKSFRSRIDDA
jgi:hypothetical protein